MTVRLAEHRGITTTTALVAAALATAPATGDTDVLVILADGPHPLHDELGAPAPAALVISEDVPAPAGFDGTVLSVGYSSRADFSASDIRVSLDGTRFTLATAGATVPVQLAIVGERHVLAALAAIAAGVVNGASVADAAAALTAVTDPEPGNLQVVPVSGAITLIDDSSDSSSASTIEALKTLAEVTDAGRRSIAVIGELSGITDPVESRDEHDRLGRIVVRLNIGLLVAVGHGARHLQAAAGLEGSWDGESVLVATPDEAYDLVRDKLRDGDIVLVKIAPVPTSPHGAHAQTDIHPLSQRLGRLPA